MAELGSTVVVFARQGAAVITVTDVFCVPERARVIMRRTIDGVGEPCVMRCPSTEQHRRCSKGLQWQCRQKKQCGQSAKPSTHKKSIAR